MPRTRRAWSTIRSDIRQILRETDSTTSFWTDAQLLIYANMMIDRRVMQLATLDEGWVVDEYETDLVSGQRDYTLPEGTGRVIRVVLTYTEGGSTIEREVPRREQIGETVIHGSGSTDVATYYPTYRLQGPLLVLEPWPQFAATGGLRIDLELAPARLSADGDFVDRRFPDVFETLLTLDVAIFALAVEHSQGDSPDNYLNHLRGLQAEYEAIFLDYAQERTQGIVAGRGFHLNDG